MQAELLCVCICVVDLPKHPQMWIQKWKHCSFDRICFALSTKRNYNKQTCGYMWVSRHLSKCLSHCILSAHKLIVRNKYSHRHTVTLHTFLKPSTRSLHTPHFVADAACTTTARVATNRIPAFIANRRAYNTRDITSATGINAPFGTKTQLWLVDQESKSDLQWCKTVLPEYERESRPTFQLSCECRSGESNIDIVVRRFVSCRSCSASQRCRSRGQAARPA